MEHAHMVRTTPKGTIGPWRCKDCLSEAPLKELLAMPCNVDIKTPQDIALMEALSGNPYVHPEDTTPEQREDTNG